jgi:hypothetical protein
VAAARRDFGFTARELRTLGSFRTPRGVQRALDSMPYHLAPTAWPPRLVLRDWTAHCLEGAVFAAVALRVLGFPPLLCSVPGGPWQERRQGGERGWERRFRQLGFYAAYAL